MTKDLMNIQEFDYDEILLRAVAVIHKPIGVADYQLIVPKEQLQELLTKEIRAFEEDYQPRSKEELTADFDDAAKDARLYREGKKEFRPAEELIDEL